MTSIPDIPTLTDVFLNVELADGSNLGKKNVNKLLKIKKKNKKPLLTIRKKELIMNIIAMVDRIGFEKTYHYLNENSSQDETKIIKNAPIFKEIRRNNFLGLTKNMVIKKLNQSAFKCPRCGEKDVTYTIFQARSSDEAATEDFQCNVCNHHWRN
jgi:DNA-directed RNA polymerase subunit M/transcription elongation factor TFIIS